MADERRVDLQSVRADWSTVDQQNVRVNWRKNLDLLQFGESPDTMHKPLGVLRYGEPHLLGLNPALYEARLAELEARGEVFSEPFEIPAGDGDRTLKWDEVPAGVNRVVIPGRAGQNNWSKIAKKVAFEGWHVIVRRNGETAGVFVPASFLGPVDEESQPV